MNESKREEDLLNSLLNNLNNNGDTKVESKITINLLESIGDPSSPNGVKNVLVQNETCKLNVYRNSDCSDLVEQITIMPSDNTEQYSYEGFHKIKSGTYYVMTATHFNSYERPTEPTVCTVNENGENMWDIFLGYDRSTPSFGGGTHNDNLNFDTSGYTVNVDTTKKAFCEIETQENATVTLWRLKNIDGNGKYSSIDSRTENIVKNFDLPTEITPMSCTKMARLLYSHFTCANLTPYVSVKVGSDKIAKFERGCIRFIVKW